jgi:hypothetical protein
LIQKINEKNKFRINTVKTMKTDGDSVPTNKAVRGDDIDYMFNKPVYKVLVPVEHDLTTDKWLEKSPNILKEFEDQKRLVEMMSPLLEKMNEKPKKDGIIKKFTNWVFFLGTCILLMFLS